MKYCIIISMLCIAFSGCSKDDAEDNEAPSITIVSPANNQVLTAGEIHIKGSISDNAYINQVHIEISDLTSGTEYLHVHIHPASKTYAFDQLFTVQAGKSYKIKLIAEDPSANSSSKQVEVTCN